jgi:hypothetical protein
VSIDRGRGAFEDAQCWTGISGAAQLHVSLQEKALQLAAFVFLLLFDQMERKLESRR